MTSGSGTAKGDGVETPAASVPTVAPHSPLTELTAPDADPAALLRPRTSATPRREQRTWRSSAGQAAYAIVPYWFVGAGIALGAGGVVQDQPLAGACGAVAGVTAGLIYQNRARYYHRQAEALRERLRAHRIEAEANVTEMRETLRSLRTEVWELRFAQQVSQMDAQNAATRVFEPSEKAQIATLATQPMDFSELRTGWTAMSARPEVIPDADPVPAEPAEAEAVVSAEPTEAESGELIAATAEDTETPAEVAAEAVPAEPAEANPDAEPLDAEPVDDGPVDAGPVADVIAEADPAEPVDTEVADAEADDVPESRGARVIDLRSPNSSTGGQAKKKGASDQRRAAVAG